MIETFSLFPGITLRCYRDARFKQGCLSLQLVRPMCRQEAGLNALIPAVLLRGCDSAPDLRSITHRLDDLYGASIGTLVRRVGDYQTTGLYCSFISDRFAMAGDGVLMPMLDFLEQLLFHPVLEKGAFSEGFVESEKKNLICAIEAQRNDKRAYASAQLLKRMCAGDSFGVPRLGEAAEVKKITAKSAYDHYQKILEESRIDLFYVGQTEPALVAERLRALFAPLKRRYRPLPAQSPLHPAEGGTHREQMEVSQGKLAMGFTTDITVTDPRFAAMQVCNMVFGGGMTSKLFMNIREKQSLCYDIGSGYHGSKGIVTVSAGIDCNKFDLVQGQILAQLEACCQGQISENELTSAKEAVFSSLRSTHDSPGAIENYYATTALSGLGLTPEEYMDKVRQVTIPQAALAAQSLKKHTVYFLEGAL